MRTTYGSGNTPIPRPRLEALAESVPSFPVTVLWGPPGVGKSSLLESVLSRTGLPVWMAHLPRALATSHGDGSGSDRQFRITDSPDPGPAPNLSDFVEQWRSQPRRGVLLLEGGPLPPDQWRPLVPPMLLESPPEGLSLVISSRGRPKLPLGKWRLAGQLLEIGPDLLRLDRSETHAVLLSTGISALPPDATEAIHRISQGWISGVILCSLHVRSSNEPENALRTLGDNPHLHEFLQQELLDELPPHLQRIVQDISILPAASGDLCDAVLERFESSYALQDLGDRTSLVERSPEGLWSLHFLARAGFSAMVRHTDPERFRTLHRRAARWNLVQGRAEDAVRHALEARDPEVLESVAERALQNLFRNSDFLALQRHARDMPPAMAHDRPFLSLFLAWALFHIGREKEGVIHLDRARRLALEGRLERASRDRQRTILAHAAFLRAIVLRLDDQPERSLQVAASALSSCTVRRPFLAASIRVQTSIGHFLSGRLASAREALQDSMARAEASDHHLAYFGAGYTLAEVLVLQGRIREAHDLLEAQRRYADAGPARGGPVSGYMEIARSRLHLVQGSVAEAAETAERGISLGRRCDNIRILNYGLAARAEIAALTGDLDGAARALDEAIAVARRTRMHWAVDHDDLEAKRVRLLLSRLAPSTLHAWLARTLPVLDQPSLPRWDHFRSAMRLLTCLGRAAEAVELGLSWKSFFRCEGLSLPLQETCYALSLACEFLGRHDPAFENLDQSLAIASNLGTSGPFHHGPELDGIRRDVFTLWTRRAHRPEASVAALVARLSGGDPRGVAPSERATTKPANPLSEREIEVLQAIREGRSNKEIADTLFVAESTVKTHLKNIFVKLGVSNRTHAVSLAQDTGIL